MSYKITHKSPGPIYICSNCGCEYQTKFKDYDKCLFCCKDENKEIQDKLGTEIRFK